MTDRNLTAEARLMVAEIFFETGPNSTSPDRACRELPYPAQGRVLQNLGLADYNLRRGWLLTYQGRILAAELNLTD